MMAAVYIEERELGGGQGGGRATLGRTRPSSPKTSSPKTDFTQILGIHLRRQFPSPRSIFWHGTTWIGKLISLAFRRYVECPKRSPYAAWASIFVRPAPGVRTGLTNKLDFNVDWALNSIFAWALVVCVLVMSSSHLTPVNY